MARKLTAKELASKSKKEMRELERYHAWREARKSNTERSEGEE